MDIIKQMTEAQKLAEDSEKDFCRLSKAIFHDNPQGKKWLKLAIARYNFTGSVFSHDDGLNPVGAAHRDGMRAVISDILNSAVLAEEPKEQRP